MGSNKVAIIGSGLGGLVCGAILSRNGYEVVIYEKNRQIGGCLQTYSRDKAILDTGVHYIGGLAKGQQLHSIFSYIGIMDHLKLKRLDADGFDHIQFGDDPYVYKLGQGYDQFISQLVTDFPDEESAIREYCRMIRFVCSKFPLYNLRNGDPLEKREVLQISASEYISSITSNVRLQQVLAGNNMLYAGVPGKTPFYIHALITNSFIESAWKCIGGGSQIARSLARCIRKNGGAIHRNCKVEKIVAEKDIATHLVLGSGEQVMADHFISNMHPAQTAAITESPLLRSAYRQRMQQLGNSIGPFLINIVLKEKSFPYLNYNYYYHATDDAWAGTEYTEEKWPSTWALFVNACSEHETYAHSLTIMTYMRSDEVSGWSQSFNTDSRPGDRGAGYEEFKKSRAKRLITDVCRKFPELRHSIVSYHAATPLTYRDYQGTADGSMYGVAKDYRETFKTFISQKTRIPNLLLTGQNLNLHGILGVSISALMTCGELLDLDELLKKIREA